jgi:hypothetical protein
VGERKIMNHFVVNSSFSIEARHKHGFDERDHQRCRSRCRAA